MATATVSVPRSELASIKEELQRIYFELEDYKRRNSLEETTKETN